MKLNCVCALTASRSNTALDLIIPVDMVVSDVVSMVNNCASPVVGNENVPSVRGSPKEFKYEALISVTVVPFDCSSSKPTKYDA